MDADFEKMLTALASSPPSNEILLSIAQLFDQQTSESLPSFVSTSFQHILTIEHWAWKELAKDSYHSMDENYMELFHALTSFNMKLVFSTDNIEAETKASLLIPDTVDSINNMFDQIERATSEDDPIITITSRWIDVLSHLVHEHTQFVLSPVIVHINQRIGRNFLMTDQYKFYLSQLRESNLSDSIFTPKQLFYIKTCSLSVNVYLGSQGQYCPYTGEEILQHLADDYLKMILVHSYTVASWSQELLTCITHLIGLMFSCCAWGNDRTKHFEVLVPHEQTSHEHVQALVRIVSHKPFHERIQAQWCNDETILIDVTLGFLLSALQTQNLGYFVRSNTPLLNILVAVAETSPFDRISLCACAILSQILSDDQLKEVKIVNNMCGHFFHGLQQAWKHPSQKYKEIPIPELLQGFLTLSHNDAIQRKTANSNKLPFLLELCDKYPIVFEILWALSFNPDIQQQLRANRQFMTKLAHLEKGRNNEKMRKIIHGILWNLESNHDEHATSEKTDEPLFDIMISYSHKDKELCKRLYEELTREGFRVWIDFDQMHGNIMDAMAQAIERSKTVVLCMSEQYRRSNFCRAEAHYAFQRQLKIVPVLLEEQYKPDGWLLFLIGQLLYVDFTKYEFSHAFDMLMKELKAPVLHNIHTARVEARRESVRVVASLPQPLPTSLLPIVADNILEWSSTQVSQWLIGHNLVQMARLLSDYNGRSLIYFNEYVRKGESQQMLTLLQEDSIRRINQSLSVVELARFRTLVDEQQQRLLQLKARKQQTETNNNREKRDSVLCCRMM